MDSKFSTMSFCREDYKEYYDYLHKEDVNENAMWDDIKEFIRITVKNGRQLKIWDDGLTIVVEYNYQDESLSGVSLEWLGEDEYVADAREDTDDKED